MDKNFIMADPRYVTLVGVSIFTSFVLLLKRYMRGGKYLGRDRLDGRTVVITGANVGLGKETAKELARRGGHIIMACRDLAKARAARDDILSQTRDGTVEVMQLDLASFESIRSFSQEVNSKYEKIDILINNAGLFTSSRKQTKDGLELTIGVCHFGHFMLTNLLLKKLKSSYQGRIVYLSSKAQEKGHIDFEDINWEKKKYNGFEAYRQAKVANVLCTRELSKHLQDNNVTVNCLHPGVIFTEIARDIPFLQSFLGRVIMVPIKWLFFKSHREGIQTTLRLVLDPALSNVTGKFFSDCLEKTPSPQALDDVTARRLWTLSQEVTQTTAN